jgi:ubiquinone/menaquinone biosynthesis C-methylase UbiE
MHAFARRLHGGSHGDPNGDPLKREVGKTNGLVLDMDWRHDLMTWAMDVFLFRGAVRTLRRRTVSLARLQPGERALDVGCGTGALALEAARQVGEAGHVVGIDPGPAQIARARAKAARLRLPVAFEPGVIERLPFAGGSFDVVFSTLMMHHLPAPLKRQGLAEIARVLAPSGRLVIADFRRKTDRQGRAARFHAGGSNVMDLAALVQEAGFSQVTTEEMAPPRFSAFPGAGFVTARKGLRACSFGWWCMASGATSPPAPLPRGEGSTGPYANDSAGLVIRARSAVARSPLTLTVYSPIAPCSACSSAPEPASSTRAAAMMNSASSRTPPAESGELEARSASVMRVV